MTAVILLAAYVLGSVNGSILVLALLGKGDPRKKFSRNAGATNVYRQAGLVWAAVVVLIEAGKAVGAAWLALHFLTPALVTWAGLALILGNRLPCFHGFRGGKGVANYLGFTLLISPASVGVSALCWLPAQILFRRPYLSSFFMVAVLGFGTIHRFLDLPAAAAGTALTLFLIISAHRENIAGEHSAE